MVMSEVSKLAEKLERLEPLGVPPVPRSPERVVLDAIAHSIGHMEVPPPPHSPEQIKRANEIADYAKLSYERVKALEASGRLSTVEDSLRSKGYAIVHGQWVWPSDLR